MLLHGDLLVKYKDMPREIYKITEEFEMRLSEYTGAPYVVCVDSCSNALFLSLYYNKINGLEVSIPSRTYPSVPCEIIHAGGKVKFLESSDKLKGAYQLYPTNVWDSALRFTADMYIPESFMCISFSGPYKHLKLSKGGAILTDNEEAYRWFKRARFSGRNECSYNEDNFDMLGWNFYMLPEISTRGLLLINGFYNPDGTKKHNEDLEIQYPDLSKFKIYNQ